MRVTSPPMTEKQKRYLRKVKGIKKPFSVDAVVSTKIKEREYYAPVKASFVPARTWGGGGCRLSAAKRAMVQSRLGQRKAFFAELGVQV